MSGFVYIWYDLEKKRFYIGAHWGTPDDGYICSSRWMKNAYKKRSKSFKRRILSFHYDKKSMFLEEQRVLSMIHKDEIGKKYYNLSRIAVPWLFVDPVKRLSVIEKLKASWTDERRKKFTIKMERFWTPEKRQQASLKLCSLQRKNTLESKALMRAAWSDERRIQQGNRLSKISKARYKNWYKMHKTRKEKLLEKRQAEDWKPTDRSVQAFEHWDKLKKDSVKFQSIKDKMSLSAKARIRTSVSEEAKANMSAATLGKKQKIVKCPHCDKEGGSATMHQWHFNNCKFKDAHECSC